MLKRLTPVTSPVTLERAKNHLRVEIAEDDDLISGYLLAATAFAEAHVALIFTPADFELTFDGWSECLDIHPAPVTGISRISYLGAAGGWADMEDNSYWFCGKRWGARIGFYAAESLPVLASRPGTVRVYFSAGYDDGLDLPPPPQAAQAILMMVGHLYANRETVVVGSGINVNQVPLATMTLLDQIRIYR